MDVHLVDGTYELFRHFYALPSARDAEGREVATVRGVLRSILGMLNGGATHVAVATESGPAWLGGEIGRRRPREIPPPRGHS